MIVNGSNINSLFTSFDARFTALYQSVMRDSFVDKLALTTTSKTKISSYPWMGKIPAMRKWAGSRQAANLTTKGITLTNDKFELTVKVNRDEIDDDQYGIYMNAVDSVALQAGRLYDQLLAALLVAGTGTTLGAAYDGLAFFHTQHLIDSDNAATGTYSNRLTTTPLNFEGLDAATTAMRRFRGEDGKGLGLKPTLLVVPPSLEATARKLMSAEYVGDSKLVSGATAAVGSTDNFWRGKFEVVVVDDIDTDSTIWYMICNDHGIRPFIKQVRSEIELTSVVNPSDASVFNTDDFLWGARARGACGYVFPQAIIRCEA